MKTLALLALAMGFTAFGQQTVVKKDGTKLIGSNLNVRHSKRQIEFRTNGKDEKIPFSELDSAIIDKKVLKRFDIGKKPKLYYVLASSNGKILGVTSSKRTRERGGFSSTITLYEVIAIENGKVIQDLKFTESKTSDEVAKRREFFDLANRFLGNCEGFMQKLSFFADDPEHLTLLHYLENPEKANCRL